nr:hypothetical protein [Burkholderia sp. WSM2232]
MDYMAYSTDGGRSFSWVRYDEDDISFDPVESSSRYAMAVGRDRLYVMEKDRHGEDAFVVQYPMFPGIDLNKPYPDGVRGASFRALSRPGFLAGMRTPSGADRYTCDEPVNDHKAEQK